MTVKALNERPYSYQDEFLHPILAHHLQGKKRISHVFIVDLKTYPKLLYITDAAINISPDLMTKMHIVQNAIDLALPPARSDKTQSRRLIGSGNCQSGYSPPHH